MGSVHFEVRDATASDASAVADLFYNTILNVNVGDYSVAQVEAWAGPAPKCKRPLQMRQRAPRLALNERRR